MKMIKLKVVVERNNKEKLMILDYIKRIIELLVEYLVEEVYKYKTNPRVQIKFKKSESGPSGGFIETLDIYNKLTKKDLTKGKKIAGTGEIDNDGNILQLVKLNINYLELFKKAG